MSVLAPSHTIEEVVGPRRLNPMTDLSEVADLIEQAFFADRHNGAAAESYLRRALEALLDLGRHILAKGFGKGVSEDKEIARELHRHGVLSHEAAGRLEDMAGYRNRMVHFYHEIAAEELYRICSHRLGDVTHIVPELKGWVREHPELMDDSL